MVSEAFKYVPQTTVTTFAFSSVFILLLAFHAAAATGITSLVIGGTLVLVSLNTNSIGGLIPLCTGILRQSGAVRFSWLLFQ